MKQMTRMPKWVKIVIGIITGIVVVVGVIGEVMYMNHECDRQYMIDVVNSLEAQQVIEENIRDIDAAALTISGHIKSYIVDYDNIEHNPMGGINVRVYVNNDPSLAMDLIFDKYSGKLDTGGADISPNLVKLGEE